MSTRSSAGPSKETCTASRFRKAVRLVSAIECLELL
jgi:hypothetical protein